MTLHRNVADLEAVALRQRVLTDVSTIDLSTTLFGQRLAMPVALDRGWPARRGRPAGCAGSGRV